MAWNSLGSAERRKSILSSSVICTSCSACLCLCSVLTYFVNKRPERSKNVSKGSFWLTDFEEVQINIKHLLHQWVMTITVQQLGLKNKVIYLTLQILQIVQESNPTVNTAFVQTSRLRVCVCVGGVGSALTLKHWVKRERTSRTLRQTSVDMLPSNRAWWWISTSESPVPSTHTEHTYEWKYRKQYICRSYCIA